MIAFVLGGGGNRGPLQVGALQVLLEHGIHPDMVVGTSVGAINAAFLASDPSLATALELGELWKKVDKDHVFHGNRLTMLWRFLTGKDSLYPNDRLQRLMEDNMASRLERFGDLQKVRLYIVATRLATGEPRVFGDDPQERVLDAIMASSALPPFFPPWHSGDELLIDGGIAADLPVRIALAKGAKEIYALRLVDAPGQGRQIRGLVSIAEQTINNVLSQQLTSELDELESIQGVTLHHVPLTGFYNLPLWDLSQAEEMIEGGRLQMEEYLRASREMTTTARFPSLVHRLRGGVGSVVRRLRRALPRNHQGVEEELELDSGTFQARA